MSQRPLGVIFSDLDGTFLDRAYHPAIDASAAADVFARWRVVWASSRTEAELRFLQDRIGHSGDAIGENGGVIVTREPGLAAALGTPEAADSVWVVQHGASWNETAERVRRAFDAESIVAPTMDTLGPAEIARRSGYSLDDAGRALRRRASVLLADVDHGDPRVQRALAALRQGGAAVATDGHWVSVVQGTDKGRAALAWLAAWSQQHGAPRLIVGIGNADNDDPLLRVVDFPFVVRREDGGYPPTLARLSGARLLKRPGTAGWLEMLDAIDQMAKELT